MEAVRIETRMSVDFGKIGFSGTLRPSQVASSSVIMKELESSSKELLIVAPPGSGKTVLGLYVWSDMVRLPTLVLSPNSAIQAQWVERAKELFHLDGRESEIGTDPTNPGILTSLTYQSVTLPRRGGDDLEEGGLQNWIMYLLENGQVHTPEEGHLWIQDLKERNPEYYATRLARNKKAIRDGLALGGVPVDADDVVGLGRGLGVAEGPLLSIGVCEDSSRRRRCNRGACVRRAAVVE